MEMEHGNTSVLALAYRRSESQEMNQIKTREFVDGTELTFRVGRKGTPKKEKHMGESHLPPPKGKHEASTQENLPLESQRKSFSEQLVASLEGERIWMKKDPLINSKRGSNIGILWKDEEGILFINIRGLIYSGKETNLPAKGEGNK